MRYEQTAVILLAEDDLADQELTRRALKEGKVENELYIVNDGEEALDYLYQRNRYADPSLSPRPDILLLDLNMPKIDGHQVLEQIHGEPRFKYMRIIVLTTSCQDRDILQSYGLGVSSYITKPVDPDQFFKAIGTLKEYWFRIVKLPPRGKQD